MDNTKKTIKSFKDLLVWQEGHKLVLEIYKKTQTFPKEEQFGLTNQLRRAGVSLTSNIAEGFSRTSYKEKLQFYSMALDSLTEIQNQLLIAKDINYVTENDFNSFSELATLISKLLNGLIKKTKTIIHNS